MTRSTHADVCVVAGGWSATMVNLEALPGYVIAVNDSAIYLPMLPDCIVSMDRLWTEHRWSWLRRMKIETWLRRAALKKIVYANEQWLHVFGCNHESSEFEEEGFNCLNGTNSGMCALNRAYQLHPERVWLVGFDCKNGPRGQRHWYPDYEMPGKDGRITAGGTTQGKLLSWAQQYRPALNAFAKKGIEVTNVSDWTELKCFPIMGSAEFNGLFGRKSACGK